VLQIETHGMAHPNMSELPLNAGSNTLGPRHTMTVTFHVTCSFTGTDSRLTINSNVLTVLSSGDSLPIIELKPGEVNLFVDISALGTEMLPESFVFEGTSKCKIRGLLHAALRDGGSRIYKLERLNGDRWTTLSLEAGEEITTFEFSITVPQATLIAAKRNVAIFPYVLRK